jgi:hypothetical protein
LGLTERPERPLVFAIFEFLAMGFSQGRFPMRRASIRFREADTLWMQSKSMESVRDVSWN